MTLTEEKLEEKYAKLDCKWKEEYKVLEKTVIEERKKFSKQENDLIIARNKLKKENKKVTFPLIFLQSYYYLKKSKAKGIFVLS